MFETIKFKMDVIMVKYKLTKSNTVVLTKKSFKTSPKIVLDFVGQYYKHIGYSKEYAMEIINDDTYVLRLYREHI